jgi:hypothetical protein
LYKLRFIILSPKKRYKHTNISPKKCHTCAILSPKKCISYQIFNKENGVQPRLVVVAGTKSIFRYQGVSA